MKSISNEHPLWPELAAAVQADRVKIGFVARSAFGRFIDVNDSTLQVIEGIRRGKVSEAMLDRVNHALGWPDGRWRELLGDGAALASSDPIRTASEIVLLRELLRRAEERQGHRAVG